MKLTNQERKENALNELKELGYFGISYWGQGDLQQAYAEINAERDEDIIDDLPELTDEQKKIAMEAFDERLLTGEDMGFGDLKQIVESLLA